MLRNPVFDNILHINFNNRVFLMFIISFFLGILGDSLEIQFLAIFYIYFNKGFNQI